MTKSPFTSILLAATMLVANLTALPSSSLASESQKTSRKKANSQEEINENLISLVDTPLTEILQRQNIKVTSVSKKSETVSNAASAIFVITAEDIRRSGLNSLPEILRMAPGIHVAQIDSSRWAVSSRGMTEQFANKLLVLIDGREIYSPLFSGVYWDQNDLILEDIERIEVIRGPGASLWGANAVNGVINVITKHTKATPQNLVSASAGTFDKYSLSARQGGEISEEVGYRVYAKTLARNSLDRLGSGASNGDRWRQSRVGFRTDAQKDHKTATISGEAFKSANDITLNLPDISAPAPFRTVLSNDEERAGGHIMAKLSNQYSEYSNVSLQTYFDRSIRNGSTLKQTADIFNIELNHSITQCDWSEFMYGFGYRNISDSYGNTFYVRQTPTSDTNDVYSSFVQNKFTLSPDELFLTLGSKFEQNSYTGSEVQPSVKLLWKVNENNSLWTSVSRAVRTPSRSENDIMLIVSPNSTGTGYISQVGNPYLQSEKMDSYEIGYRATLKQRTFFDATVFYSEYEDLRTLEPQANVVIGGTTFTPFKAENLGNAKSYGAEFSIFHELTSKINLKSNYSILTMETGLDSASADPNFTRQEGTSPSNNFSVGFNYDVTDNIELDSNYYFVDELSKLSVNSYQRLDSKISYLPDKNTEISLIGQNLLDDKHQEFSAPLNGFAVEIPRAVMLKFSKYF